MKKSILASALVLGMGADIASAVQMNSASFDMFDPLGNPLPQDATVTGAIGGGSWSVASTTPFFGVQWVASGGSTWGPGTYDVNTDNLNPDVGPSGTVAGCGGGAAGCYEGISVGGGQVMGHIFFAWGASSNIDVVNVWDIIDNGNGTVTYSSQDVELASPAAESLDGISGLSMIDGPFGGFNANFNFTTSAPPKAVDDSKGTTIDIPVSVDLVANDSAADMTSVCPAPLNQPCAVTPAAVPPTIVNLPASPLPSGATLADTGNGTVLYTPPLGAVLVDTFQYSITDNATPARTSAMATVTISVLAAANTPPSANDIDFSNPEDMSLDIAVTDADDNGTAVATDLDGDDLTYASFDAASTGGGTVAVDATNTVLTYTPATDFNGPDTFTFTVTDGIDNSSAGTVTVNVAPVNDPLVCTDVNVTAVKNIALDLDVADKLLSTCVDPDTNDTISLDSTTQPTQPGSMLSYDGNNILTYTPETDFVGQDTFTYTATDGTVSDTRTVFIDVVDKIFGNFTMIDPSIATIGGTNDVIAQWDGVSLCDSVADPVSKCPMSIGSDTAEKFKGFPWFAHDIRVFDEGIYTFDTVEGAPLSLTVGQGQIGAHILFDWNVTKNIDVVLVWDIDEIFEKTAQFDGLFTGPAGPTPAEDCQYELVSRDSDGDGVPGAKMVDGPFIDFQANFNLNFTRNCGIGVSGPNPVSTIKSPNIGGGCVIGSSTTRSMNRMDLWIVTGFIAWLGIMVSRRRCQ